MPFLKTVSPDYDFEKQSLLNTMADISVQSDTVQAASACSLDSPSLLMKIKVVEVPPHVDQRESLLRIFCLGLTYVPPAAALILMKFFAGPVCRTENATMIGGVVAGFFSYMFNIAIMYMVDAKVNPPGRREVYKQMIGIVWAYFVAGAFGGFITGFCHKKWGGGDCDYVGVTSSDDGRGKREAKQTA